MIDGKIDTSKFERDAKPIDVKYYLARYSRYWPLYGTCVLVALTGVFLFHRYSVEEYEVRGSILINQKNTPEVKILDRSNIFSGSNNLENDILLLTSKNLAEEAFRKLHFDVSYFASTHIKEVELYDKSPIRVEVDWTFPQSGSGRIHFTLVSEDEFVLNSEEKRLFEFLTAKASGVFDDQLSNRVYRFGEIIRTERSKFVIHKRQHMSVGEKLSFITHHPSDMVDDYIEAIAVKPINSYGTVLQVSTVSRLPEKGRDYVNALMDAYLEYDLKEKNRITENTLNFLDEQMVILEDSLKSVESQMLRFKVDNKLLDVDAEYSGVLTSIRHLDDMVQQIDFELSYYKSLQSYLIAKGDDYADILAPSVVGLDDGFLNGLIKRLLETSLERRKLLTVVNESHPNVAQLNEEITKLRENIFENIDHLVANTERRRKQVSGKLEELDREFSRLPQTESRYSSLFRQYRLRENLYNYLLEKRAEAGIVKASNVSDNAILDYAKKGDLVFPRKNHNYGMAAGLGFLVPLALLLIYHYFNDKIMDHTQLKNVLSIPLLGTIGLNTKATNMMVSKHPQSRISEAFRSLRSGLSYMASEEKCKRIIVTSSVSGEGKTFVSLNLAAAMALSGKKTCLIGLDLRKPKLSEYAGIENKIGLSSYLVGNAAKEEIVIASDHENLYLIPSGPIPPNPAELLLKKRTGELLEYLGQNFEVIVMDTPPLGLVSETMDLLRFSDINLYVVRQAYTHRKHLLMINDLYAGDQISNVYAVFNGVRSGGDFYDFGGVNYGYAYNYAYARDDKYAGYFDESEERRLTFGWLHKWWLRFRS